MRWRDFFSTFVWNFMEHWSQLYDFFFICCRKMCWRSTHFLLQSFSQWGHLNSNLRFSCTVFTWYCKFILLVYVLSHKLQVYNFSPKCVFWVWYFRESFELNCSPQLSQGYLILLWMAYMCRLKRVMLLNDLLQSLQLNCFRARWDSSLCLVSAYFEENFTGQRSQGKLGLTFPQWIYLMCLNRFLELV